MTATGRSGAVLRQEQRRLRVAEMRRAGDTLQQIADTLSVSVRTVQRDVDHILGDTSDDRAGVVEAWRLEAVDDLRELADRLWRELDRPDVNAQGVAAIAGALIRGIERTSTLLGADKPTRIALGADQSDPPPSIVDLYCRLPPRAIERAKAAALAAFDEALRRRREYDTAQAARIAEMRGETPDEPEPEEPGDIEPDEVAEPDEPSPPASDEPAAIVVPADRREARQIDRALRDNFETNEAIRSWKRANNRVTPPETP